MLFLILVSLGLRPTLFEKLCLQAAQKDLDARRAKSDELRRTLQYVEANRVNATKHMSLFEQPC